MWKNSRLYSITVSVLSILALTTIAACAHILGTPNPVISDITLNLFSSDVLKTTPVYYVDNNHSSSSDLNDGTEDSPWSTITHAVLTAPKASRIIVKTGVYDERVTVDKGGNSIHFFVIEANGTVSMHGFRINADYVGIKGFTITDTTPQQISWNGYGIWINADNIYLTDNKIYNFTISGGISGSWETGKEPANVMVENNYVYGCNTGIYIYGDNWLVKNNNVERLIRGEIDGRDADYVRFFGNTIIIKNNYFHGTIESEIGESHVDIFQTWNIDNTAYPYAHNVLIEQNIATGLFHQGFMVEANERSHSNIIFRRNIFSGGTSYGLAVHGLHGIYVENNIFANISYHGVGFMGPHPAYLNRSFTIGTIKNNIFYFAGSNYWKEDGCVMTSGYNLLYPTGKAKDITDIVGIDPQFVNPLDIIGPDGIPFTADDGFRLKSSSYLFGRGELGINIGAY